MVLNSSAMSVHPATGVRIRLGGSADYEFVGQLGGEAFREFSEAASTSTLAMLKTGITLIAEKKGRPVGFAVIELRGQRLAHLSAIAVVYSERGTGVGALLLHEAEHQARKRGAARLELCTADSNLEALELFFKNGFALKHRHGRYYARGQSACQLVKPI